MLLTIEHMQVFVAKSIVFQINGQVYGSISYALKINLIKVHREQVSVCVLVLI